ncbi:MAG: insulinase family protein [Bacteroidota bacterium]
MKQTLLRLLLLLTLAVAISPSVMAQPTDLKQKPPLDPLVRTGVLENGMHYYIRSNKMQEKRGEFYIAHNVGAILEEDNQNGLAHFTEHMAFNGTRNFPKKGVLDYLATIGVKFGTNVNASTGLERTVYNLSNVPLLREGVIDTALLILHDWSNYISFEPVEIDLERGVIREEWRMYGSASERMGNLLAPVIYKGSKYALRNVIGDTAVINHFSYETIKNFYKKWYRPDLQAIVVVGDFDENVMEAKIRKLFSTIPKAENPAVKEEFGLPDNTKPLIGTATDKEATGTMVNVYYKHDATRDGDKNLAYMRTQLLRSLISSMFGQRMSELANRENPPFLSARSYYGQFTRSKDAFSGMAVAANNKSLIALTALLTEMERMSRYGFTQGEFDRAKADLMRNYESRYMDRDKRKNRELVSQNIGYFLYNNPNPGVEFEYRFAQTMFPGISLDEVNQETKKYVRNDNQVITITGPEKPGVTMPTQAEIKSVLDTYKAIAITPYVDMLAGKSLITKEPVPGQIVSTSSNSIFGTIEWVLSNGMHVVFKPTDIKEDELMVRGFSAGGTSLLSDDLLQSADLFSDAVTQMGVGSFSRTDLSKMMAGKRASVSVGLTGDQDFLTGRTSPKDLETTLQLIHLYFTNPRWDPTDYKTWMEKVKSSYINMASDPRTAMSDTIAVMMSDHNRRAVPLTYELLDRVSLEKIRTIWLQRFNDPGNFTFLFVGKIDPAQAKPFVEKYLASLPTVKRNETYKDDGISPPKGKVMNDFKHESKTPRTIIFDNLNGKCGYTANDRLLGAAIRHILELRYVQSIREDEGGAYSVRVSWALDKYPQPGFRFTVNFDTDPAKADKLLGIVHKEVANMIEKGPSETDLQKAKEYFLKQRPEDMKENTWWNTTLTDYYFYGLNYLTGYEEMVKALNQETIHGYAQQTLIQGNEVVVIMRPK